jgi:hypothetical protein
MAKVLIEETTLTAIGDAIRGKENSADLVPVNDMATRISAIQGGGSELPEAAFILTGDCSYKFMNGQWDWYLELFKDKMTSNNLTSLAQTFRYNYNATEIPLTELNMTTKQSSGCNCNYLFDNCSRLTAVPYLNGVPESMQQIFNACNRLKFIPEDWADHIDWTRIHTYLYAGLSQMFNSCYCLRHIPQSLLDNLWSTGTSGNYVPYYSMFRYCATLNELNNVAVQKGALTSNRMTYMIEHCYMLKKFTFAVQPDGMPYTAQLKAQTLDLSSYTGWLCTTSSYYKDYITGYGSGVTSDTRVTDEASYQALKSNPDWWTSLPEYSKYNHDSAVETINSLPDTSAFGTNTIKFKKTAGANTDGGAIQNLTAEEIAVAAAKGWTVTLV